MHTAHIGQSVSVLFYVEDRPVAVNGSVTNLDPFTITSGDSSAEWLSDSRRAMLIARNDSEFSKAEAELKATCDGATWTIVAADFGWEQVDRRRYPRYEVQIPVTVRAVIESGNTAELKYLQATTEDLSLGGAWLKSEQKLPSGILVECQVNLPNGANLRVLSTIRWADTLEKTGFGVEFLDFLGGSRQLLQQYLAQAA
jgi:hypothetical protein